MANIRELVENKEKLNYAVLCKALIQQFGVNEPVNFESVLPASQQQELFGGEVLRLIEAHPTLTNQKDIRPIALKKGSLSQMLFFYVCLPDASLPKKHTEQITKRFIKGTDANRYIIWFFGNKEQTELKVVLSGREGKKIVLKTLPFAVNQPYYKTYDFILNEVHQKVQRLFVEPTDLWRELWKAFDISIVNRRFYEEIKRAFDKLLLQELNKSGVLFKDETIRVQFAIRLLGRIIFCWFLKRKGIIDDSVLSSKAVQANNSNYYHDLLEVLFFDVFNKPVKERKKGSIPDSVASYPFLNGGLFEDQKTDYKGNWQLQISNSWFYQFFNDTLERYNFTVDENSSTNAEIAIDPEMLGRIFENLLAEQNTETKALASDRKSTGSFYTPREIVDYMVETSIVEYLQNAFPSNLHSDLQDFVHETRVPDSLKNETSTILKLLSEVKVLDPACGSGAFPMGILYKLSQLKSLLDKQKSLYKIKLETVEQSIYGMDIQPMATELSRLRCWLSIIVDENISKVKPLPNLDFKFISANSLIDLGYDTFLKQLQKEGALLAQPFIDKVNELKEIRRQFFEVSTENRQKENLINEFKQLQNDLYIISLDLVKVNPVISEFVNKLAGWYPFDDSKVAPFFSKSWMFGVEEGFDIVIGNPPYIKEYTNRAAFDGLRDSPYYQGKMDLWYLFACRFVDNLKQNTGILTFIATNNWVTNAGASKLRNKIVTDAQIVQLIDFGNYKIFESADIQTMIMVFKSQKQLQEYEFDYRKINDTQANLDDVVAILNKGNSDKYLLLEPIFARTYLKDKSFLFSENETELILNEIYSQSNFRLDEKEEIAQGIVAPQDFINKASLSELGNDFLLGQGIFVLTNREKESLGATSKELTLIKPYYTTEELDRFYGNKENKYWIIYTDSSFKNPDNIKPYPNLKRHLDKFVDVITSDNAPYGLHRSRDEYFFKGEKIISLRKCSIPTFTYTNFDCYVSQTFFVIKSERINQKYLTALLNSKVIAFWLRHKGKMQGFQYQVDKGPLIELPLIRTDDSQIFETLVDYLLFLKENSSFQVNEYVKNDHLIQSFEEVINACVYELYFGDHMKEKGIDVIKYAGDLVRPIHSLPQSEKARVINSVYSRLKEPSNEIRNRMMLFATRSENTLLPIQKIY